MLTNKDGFNSLHLSQNIQELLLLFWGKYRSATSFRHLRPIKIRTMQAIIIYTILTTNRTLIITFFSTTYISSRGKL